MDAELWKERLSMTKNKTMMSMPTKPNKKNNTSMPSVNKRNQFDVMRMMINKQEEFENKLNMNEGRLSNLEDTMRINGLQEYNIHSAGQKSVMEALGGKESKAYKQISKKAFSALWRSFKHYFGIPRYGELPAKQYKEGLDFASTWQPDQEMKMLIAKINRG